MKVSTLLLLMLATLAMMTTIHHVTGKEEELVDDYSMDVMVVKNIPVQTKGVSYKPVIMLHGILMRGADFNTVIDELQKQHPGTSTFSLRVYEGMPDSTTSLHVQVREIAKTIRKLYTQHPDIFADGHHFLCHSQGGMICRVLTQYMNDHKVDTLITMAAPHMGVWDSHYFHFFRFITYMKLTVTNVWRFAYLGWVQKSLSVANLWHDPNHGTTYKKYNTFLPKWNNLNYKAIEKHAVKLGEEKGVTVSRVPSSEAGHDLTVTAADVKNYQSDTYAKDASYKTHFLRIKKAVFAVGSFTDKQYDGAVGPWQSAIFGYYNGHGDVVSMKDQLVYMYDSFGLRSLDERGGLYTVVVPGADHSQWLTDRQLMTTYLFPHLT